MSVKHDGSNDCKVSRTTIYDVAKAASVSPSTVSHVLNGTASISEETTEKVMAAVKSLKYYPNSTARSLRKKRSKLIGLVMQDMTSEFYSIMCEQMLVRAQKEEFQFSIMCGQWDGGQNTKNIESLIEYQAEGIIALGSCVQEADLKKAENRGIKVVLCDQYSPNFPSVEWNNYTTMRKLVHCFVAEGLTRIAYVCTNARRQDSAVQRHLGYLQGMRDEGLDPEKLVIPLDIKESKPYQWGRDFTRFQNYMESVPRSQWPEAVLCEHDAIALAITNSLTLAGVRIPEEIQIFGFDDTSHASFSIPKLSTIRQDPRKLGDATFDMLHALIRGEDCARHVRLEQEVVIRSSAHILPDYLDREQFRYSYNP